MHNVLDPRDLVPDEAEELQVSGYPVGDLLEEAKRAAADGDLEHLTAVEVRLAELRPLPDWPYDEPRDEHVLYALCDAAPRTEFDAAVLPERIRGAWLGRVVGNTLGKPIEGLARTQVEIYLRAAGHWPLRGYLPLLSPLPDGVAHLHPSAPIATDGRFQDVPRDDDIDWTILGMLALEQHGREFTTDQLAALWLDRMPFTQTYTAERAAYRNLLAGLAPPATATHRNPYREWIGALIRVDTYGYIHPGNPGPAAALAITDARLSHLGNGMYGAMWAAGLVAAAFAASSAREALDRSLTVVPSGSRLAEALHRMLDLHDQGETHVVALDTIDRELGHYSWVHTINNAAQITAGLLWGENFLSAVGIAIEGGRDTDSNAATVGSVFGALHGSAAIPESLLISEPVRVRSAVRDFDRITIDELTARTLRLVEKE
ncbi:ADP-ribosylglycohydrolase family protein [Cryobacterium sp. Y62]|uniref:ADP-ribosylglycohydrolase family protein n=1 Tax=Cryobacterium sp. Y62 TaxID=2048284 RepID=UPI000CE4B75D|nr:ADP-ribosylglycohydrolase family protein [Cryobacterium sp. Y62]